MLLTRAKLNQAPQSRLSPPQTPARLRARTLLKRRKHLSEDDWYELYDYLEEYIDDTSNRVIAPKYLYAEEFELLSYEHRFTKCRLKKTLKDFERIWEVASLKYDVGIFITLTMDPSA